MGCVVTRLLLCWEMNQLARKTRWGVFWGPSECSLSGEWWSHDKELLENGLGWAAWKLHLAFANHNASGVMDFLKVWLESPFIYQIGRFFLTRIVWWWVVRQGSTCMEMNLEWGKGWRLEVVMPTNLMGKWNHTRAIKEVEALIWNCAFLLIQWAHWNQMRSSWVQFANFPCTRQC